MEHAMTDEAHLSLDEQRRLVQRILAEGIPSGRELDGCRQALLAGCADDEATAALFTLLQGAVADPLFGIEDSVRLVPILQAIARGELRARELL
jgi:hypothetical protein